MKKIIAIWMMILIITIPFYSAWVLAASLSNTYATGETTQIEGVINDEENIEIRTTASRDGGITEDEISIHNQGCADDCSSETGFECVTAETGYDCIYVNGEMQDDYLNLRVRLEEAVARADLCLDNTAPSITSWRLSGDTIFRADDNVQVSYTIKDSANDFNSACLNRCSGVKEMIFHRCDSGNSYSVTINTPDCVFSGTAAIPIADISDASGSFDICAYAVDMYGNSAESNKIGSITVDSDGPLISEYIRIVDSSGNLVTEARNDMQITIQAYIYDSSGIAEVKADLSDFGGLDVVDGSCSPAVSNNDFAPKNTVCSWTVTLQTNDGTLRITITATDILGQEKRLTKDMTIGLDNTPPQILSLKSEYQDETGQDYIANRAKFIAEIMEENQLSKAELFTIALTSADRTYGSCQRDSSADKWLCYWDVSREKSRHGSETKIYIPQYAVCDMVGNCNPAQYPSKSLSVIVDTAPPDIESVEIESNIPPIENAYIGSDKITITAKIRELSIVNAKADLTDIVQPVDGINLKEVDGSCTEADSTAENSIWECVWDEAWMRLHAVNGPRKIKLNFKDSAGNQGDATKLIEITSPDMTIKSISVESNEYAPIEEGGITYLVGTSTLKATAEVKTTGADGDTGITAEADFRFGEKEAKDIQADCEAPTQETEWYAVCTWDTSDLTKFDEELSLPREGTAVIGFEFSDNLGNSQQSHKEIPIKTPELAFVGDGMVKWEQEGLEELIGSPTLPPNLEGYAVSGLNTKFIAKIRNIEQGTAAITGHADFSEIAAENPDDYKEVQGSCLSKQEGDFHYWECTWRDIIITDESGEKTVVFGFEDTLGNTKELEIKVRVIPIADTQQEYWDIGDIEAMPEKIDRQMLQFTDQRVYFKIGLTPKQEDIETVHIAKAKCTGFPVNEQDESSRNSLAYLSKGDFNLMYIPAGSTEIWMYGDLRPQSTDALAVESLKFECQLSIVTKVGEQFISMPEEKDAALTIEFYNIPLGPLSEGLESRIGEVQDGLFKVGGWLGFLDRIFAFAEKICTILKILADLNRVLALLSKAMEPLHKLHIPLIGDFGHALANVFEKMSVISGVGSRGAISGGYKWCKFISCDAGLFMDAEGLADFMDGLKLDGLEDLVESLQGPSQETVTSQQDLEGGSGGLGRSIGGATGSELNRRLGRYRLPIPLGSDTKMGEYTASDIGLQPSNIKNSLVLSMATGCIPGILYNLRKYRQIQCSYVMCLKQAVAQGVSPATCDKARSYLMCTYVYGQIFQLIPFVSALKYIGNLIKAMLSNPVALLGGLLTLNCESKVSWFTNIPSALCEFTYSMGMIGRIIEDLKSIREHTKWDLTTDLCREAGIR